MGCRVKPGNDEVKSQRAPPRHCEERQRRSNPVCAVELDCFAFGSQ
jgi:hypothetical protein